MNLRSIPGTTYPIGSNFSNIQMPPGSPFRSSWWYRTSFSLRAGYQGKQIHLHFDGINFRANVWLNGRQIANSQQLAGSWRLFEFDVTNTALAAGPNALAVEVFPPTPDDLAITFVDWNPAPPDKGMGIWRDVYLSASGPVTVRFPQVVTKLNLPSTDESRLTVSAEVTNCVTRAVSGVLKGDIGEVSFSQPVTLAAGAHEVVTFSPDGFRQLVVKNPKLWWPAPVGPQNLYRLNVQFETDGNISDSLSSRFGIREVTSQLEPAPGTTEQSADGDNRAHRACSRSTGRTS